MNMKRMRRGPRHGGGGGGGGQFRPTGGGSNNGNQPLNRNHSFDSSGPDVRLRGTAQQLFEKYLQLGRDATSAGDRVAAEGYFQHAEHYFRILTAMNQVAQSQGQGGGQQGQRRPHDAPPDAPTGNEPQTSDYRSQPSAPDEDDTDEPPGMGDQPQPDSRDIPIAAAPSEA